MEAFRMMGSATDAVVTLSSVGLPVGDVSVSFELESVFSGSRSYAGRVFVVISSTIWQLALVSHCGFQFKIVFTFGASLGRVHRAFLDTLSTSTGPQKEAFVGISLTRSARR